MTGAGVATGSTNVLGTGVGDGVGLGLRLGVGVGLRLGEGVESGLLGTSVASVVAGERLKFCPQGLSSQLLFISWPPICRHSHCSTR